MTRDQETAFRGYIAETPGACFPMRVMFAEIDALRSALAEACDGWEEAPACGGVAAFAEAHDRRVRIARLRALLPDPKMHWREEAK